MAGPAAVCAWSEHSAVADVQPEVVPAGMDSRFALAHRDDLDVVSGRGQLQIMFGPVWILFVNATSSPEAEESTFSFPPEPTQIVLRSAPM